MRAQRPRAEASFMWGAGERRIPKRNKFSQWAGVCHSLYCVTIFVLMGIYFLFISRDNLAKLFFCFFFF